MLELLGSDITQATKYQEAFKGFGFGPLLHVSAKAITLILEYFCLPALQKQLTELYH